MERLWDIIHSWRVHPDLFRGFPRETREARQKALYWVREHSVIWRQEPRQSLPSLEESGLYIQFDYRDFN